MRLRTDRGGKARVREGSAGVRKVRMRRKAKGSGRKKSSKAAPSQPLQEGNSCSREARACISY